MMTQRMKRMAQANRAKQPQGAPRRTMIAGQPHMLAYINEAERQMLKRAGGAEAPGPAGIPSYFFWGGETGFGDWGDSVADAVNDVVDSINEALGGNGGNDGVYQGPNIDGSSGYTIDSPVVTELDTGWLTDDNVAPAYTLDGGEITDAGQTITNPDGTVITLENQQETYPRDYMPAGFNSTSTGNSTSTTSDSGSTSTAVVNTGPTEEELAEQARLAALDAALSRLAKAFGFATDDYFAGLGTSYLEGGLSESFQTAYDDAQRGIMDQFKAQGLLTQSDVDDEMGILKAALGGEEGRLDNIVSSYVDANRNYVSGGRSSIEDTLRGLGSAEAINAFNIDAAVQPYREPTEQAVVDFFTDFVKRAYDPSYNVDPTAVASGNPKRVSESVDQQGANNSPSALSGIFDPVSGSSAKVIK